MGGAGLDVADNAVTARSSYAPRSRMSAIVPIALAHTAVLALVAVAHSGGVPVRHAQPGLAIFDVAPPAPSAARPRPVAKAAVLPPPVIELPAPDPQPALVTPVALAPELEAVPSGGCDLTDTIQAALRESAAARAAIEQLPVADRSVANAVMVWDGNWVAMASPAGRDALSQVRTVMAETIAAASVECRAQLQAGPRLIAIPGAPDVTLALGSGRWRWGDLAATEIAQVDRDKSAAVQGRAMN